MTSEQNIMRQIMLACSRGASRLFRNNVARAWVGDVIARTPDTITLKNPRPLHAGLCVGSSDLLGWRTVTITPEMVGQSVGVFAALEVKTKTGRATAEQKNFIEAVNRAGGLAGVVRSEEEALELLNTQRGTESRGS